MISEQGHEESEGRSYVGFCEECSRQKESRFQGPEAGESWNVHSAAEASGVGGERLETAVWMLSE